MSFNRGKPVAETGLSISQANAAGAYARSELLGATIPVRPADPVRQRFQVADQTAADQADAQSQSAATDPDQQSAAGKSAGGSLFGSGSGLLGAFTSFLARFFGQGEAETAGAGTSATALRTGAEAYGRAASIAVNDNPGIEVLSPSFPRLSSGRTLDLSV